MPNENAPDHWRQVDLWCHDWLAAEQMAVTQLRPLLTEAERAGSIINWWFVRKGKSWRLRFQPADHQDGTATAFIDRMAATLLARGAIHRHAEVIYEPETHAFGGATAMDVAHALFHADSYHVLHHLATANHEHRSELGLLLGSRLMRAAGQDCYEQGDVWARLGAHRADQDSAVPSSRMVAAVQRLITAIGDADDSPLRSTPAWPASFEHAGRALARLSRRGDLTRGLRAVLAHHLLFAFNRLGIPSEHQYLLAAAACQVVFHHDHTATIGPAGTSARPRPTTVSTVTSQTMDTATPDPETLRTALADYIRGRGTFRTAEVEAAFRTVPRHRFLPGVDLATAYAPKPVVTKRTDNGTAISSASSPNLVAEMLEQLAVRPGNRVLEIGAATGINAALLAELAGPAGQVVTIELDEDLAAGARNGLAAAGYPQVEVICGDGALGHAERAPYDRIIVTAGAWDIATAWWQQLAVGGRMVVPLRLHGSGLTRAIAFDLDQPGQMTSSSAIVCGFVPMRGTTEHDEAFVHLTDDVVLHVDANDVPDQAALSRALTYPAHTQWTGIEIRDDEPAEHLDLWLLTTGSGSFGRLSVGSVARSSGLADPALRWAGATVYDGGTLAYIATRECSDDVSELGMVAHGPDSDKLAAQVGELLHHWGEERPSQPSIVVQYIDAFEKQPSATASLIVRPHTQVTITW